ncbi:hypothetical protein D3C76_1300070 [compost metagenome]
MTLGIHMPLIGLDRGDHLPDPMQLIAGQVLVDVPGLDHIGVLEVRRVELVAVVGDVHFLLADQLPVIAIRRSGKHVEVVRGAQPVGRGAHAVIGHLRCPAHTALTGVVDPGLAGFLDLVEGFVNQQHVARQARRRGDFLLEIVEDVFIAAWLQVSQQ